MMLRQRAILPTAAPLVAASLLAFAAAAFSSARAEPPSAKAPPASPASSSRSAPVPMPDNDKLMLMIQLHVAALALANLTGNYTVLHALGTPSFQAVNAPPVLAERFVAFRQNGIDISPALVFAPVLAGAPATGENEVLRVVGFYPTEPQRIAFDLLFQPVDGMWRLANIDVRTVVPEPPAPIADDRSGTAGSAKTLAAIPASAPKK